MENIVINHLNYLYVIIGVVVFVGFWAIYAYNNFVTFSLRTDEAWSDISVQLKRRYDLIPNLVETVKGYAGHEKETLARVTEMRAKAINATTVADHNQADNMLTGALKSLFAVSESYPDLKANHNFLELQRELADTENKIQAARRFYNTNVRDFNIVVDSFPSNLIARIFSFIKKDFFELGEEESVAKNPVKVSF